MSMRRFTWVAGAAMVALVSTGVQAPLAASAESDEREFSKITAGAVVAVPLTGNDEQVLAAENKARASSLPEDVSPGSFQYRGEVVNRVFADRSVPSTVRTMPSRFTRASLSSLEKELVAIRDAAKDRNVAYGYYHDAVSDVLRVEGNVAEQLLPVRALVRGEVSFTHTVDAGRDSRTSDSAPHWGGARITSGGAACSSGFTVRDSTGTRFAVTAAHCGQLNSAWYSGAYYFGTVTRRGPFPAWDMALLSGSSYGTYIYMGGSAGNGWPTGPADNPVVGFSYCTSGATTYENCGKVVTSLSASFCDSAGCTHGLASYTGGSSTAGGDSGGPLVLKGSSVVYPRGIHIARSGSTMYAEKWSSISSNFGVSSVSS